MKIADIVAKPSTLESLFEKRAGSKTNLQASLAKKGTAIGDGFETGRAAGVDSLKMQEIEKNYLSGKTGLKGLGELDRIITLFEGTPEANRNYSDLNAKIKSIIDSSASFGKDTIAKLSDAINDGQSLLKMKNNVLSEINSIQSRVNSDRKELAGFLVKSENRETAAGFSVETAIKNVVGAAAKTDSLFVFKSAARIHSLLDMSK